MITNGNKLLHSYITKSLYKASSDETIGCYRFGGQGTFNDALTTCSNTGGYLVGIDTALENTLLAGEKPNRNCVIFAFL